MLPECAQQGVHVDDQSGVVAAVHRVRDELVAQVVHSEHLLVHRARLLDEGDARVAAGLRTPNEYEYSPQSLSGTVTQRLNKAHEGQMLQSLERK